MVPVAAFAATPAQSGVVTSVASHKFGEQRTFTLTASAAHVKAGPKVYFHTNANPATAVSTNGVPGPRTSTHPLSEG